MKKILCILLICSCLLSLTSCATGVMAQSPVPSEDGLPVQEEEITSVENETETEKLPWLPYEILEIAVGDSYCLDLPEGEWTTSNQEVAVVDRFCELTGLSAGKTWLTTELDGELITIPVTVTADPELPKEEKTESKKDKYRIVVNKIHNYVAIYDWEDEALKYPLRAMICSTGQNTPNGTYSLGSRKVWNRLYGYVWGKYATVITGHFLFHSVPFAEKDSSTLLTKEYNKLGTTASAGCIRMTVEGAKWIYDYCKPGSKVIFTKEDVPCPLEIEPAIRLQEKSGWDPTDPDPKNPWHKKGPAVKAADRLVALGEPIDIASLFTATDTAGNDISDRVEVGGVVNTDIPGIYVLRASVTDDLGNRAEAHSYVRVVAPKIQNT